MHKHSCSCDAQRKKPKWTKQWQYLSSQIPLYKIKTNLKMCVLMYFKIQSDQPRITQNALKSQIFDLFTKSLSGHNDFENKSKI